MTKRKSSQQTRSQTIVKRRRLKTPVDARPPSAARKSPQRKKRFPRGTFVVLLVGTIFICLVMGIVGMAPASAMDDRPRMIAMLLSATPTATDTPTPTNTPTPTSTPTQIPTSTITLTPSITPTQAPTLTPTPWPTPDGLERRRRVAILMYHYVSTPPEDADVYRQDLSISPETFREQMAWLHENGWETITLYDLTYALTLGWPLPEKPVLLTFDDGYVDNYTNAFPILQEFGFVGTFFVLTGPTDRGDPAYMTWEMLREMSQAGMDIEVHGREHIDLSGRDYDFLVYHLLGPAQTIEAELGYYPRFVAYPSGRYDENTITVAHSAGYWGALTTHGGVVHESDSVFELDRLRIRGNYTLEQFAMQVERDLSALTPQPTAEPEES